MDSQPFTTTPPTPPPFRPPDRRTSRSGHGLRRYALVPAAALSLAVVLAGCDDTSASSSPPGSSHTTPDSAAPRTPTVAASSSDEPSPSGTTAPEGPSKSGAAEPTEPATQAGQQRCTAAQLTPGVSRSDGGAGQIYYRLTLTNTSDAACVLQGFPGVSLIKRDGGVIGDPAEREGAAGKKTVLKPGGSTAVTLHTVNQGLTDAPCWDHPDYLKIYPPGSKEAVTLRTTEPLVCGDRFTTTAVGG